MQKIFHISLGMGSPVCGKDGVTYSDECQMICAGVEEDYKGECSGLRSIVSVH